MKAVFTTAWPKRRLISGTRQVITLTLVVFASVTTVAATAATTVAATAANTPSTDCVILLHGLARTSAAMEPLAVALIAQGYVVANVDYPSREKTIQVLAPLAIAKGLASCPDSADRVHFVTHSLGGILVRYYLETTPIAKLGRVVMLGPPNQGSQVVDNYRNVPGYQWLNGPAGLQLGTDKQSIPAALGPVEFPLGVIAGTKTFNPVLSLSLPNPDDGKVSLESTKVDGMTDFIAVPHTHTFMMRAEFVIEQVIYFLAHEKFRQAAVTS